MQVGLQEHQDGWRLAEKALDRETPVPLSGRPSGFLVEGIVVPIHSTSTTIISFSAASRFWGALLPASSVRLAIGGGSADRRGAGPADWHVVELGLFRRGRRGTGNSLSRIG